MKIMPLLRGELNKFKSSRSHFVSLFQAKLAHGNISFQPNDGVQALHKKLKQHENQQRIQVKEKADKKFFKPLHKSAQELGIEL
jgi:hypothetical protein